MKRGHKTAAFLFLLASLVLFVWGPKADIAACSGSGCSASRQSHECAGASTAKVWGQPDVAGKVKVERISDLATRPGSLLNRVVCVKGAVRKECPSGGSFYLEDKTGRIFVNLHKSSFTIPQIEGHHVKVCGEVVEESGKVSIIGKRVEKLH